MQISSPSQRPCANTLAEPSCCMNTNNSSASHNASSSSSRPTLPKLTAAERQLLFDNEGCLKCRHVFVPHRSATCPNNFPDLSNYKQLTQFFVDAIKKRLGKPVAAIMTAVDNVNSTPAAITAPVAAVMGMARNPVMYMPSNTSNVIEGDSDSDVSVSLPLSVAVVTNHGHVALKAQHKDLALFTVPHFFW